MRDTTRYRVLVVVMLTFVLVALNAAGPAQVVSGAEMKGVCHPPMLTSFAFDSVGDQTAGSAFQVTITALDQCGYRMTSYSGSADLSDTTGTISPTTTGAFSDGQWTGEVTITAAASGVQITAQDGDVSGVSDSFDVEASAVVDHFAFGSIGDQTAGVPFAVTVTARDAWDNTVSDYAGPANLSDTTGTISPTTTGAFSDGVWTGEVTITDAADVVTITVQDGDITGESNRFSVSLGVLDHFVFAPIPTPQMAGVPFAVTVIAQDAWDNPVTNYTGTASLVDTTESIEPTEIEDFTDGVWMGDVRIAEIADEVTITVQDNDNDAIGVSNSFVVTGQMETEPNDTMDESDSIAACLPQKHQFDAPGDVDWVKFRAWAGLEYAIDTLDLSPTNRTMLELYDAEGALLERDVGFPAASILWIAPESGTYYVKVTHPKGLGGPEAFAYSLSVCGYDPCSDAYEPDNTQDDARQITLDEIQERTFHGPSGGDVDWAWFNATAGKTYAIRTLSLSSGNDTVLWLFSAEGEMLAYNEDDPEYPKASRINWVAPSDGVYFVKVAPFNPSVGGCEISYDLQVLEIEALPPEPAPPSGDCPDDFEVDDTQGMAKAIEVNGASQAHSFHSASDRDWIKFWVFDGNVYTLETFNLSSGNDTRICLYVPEEICDDDSGTGLGSKIVWEADASGTYFARIDSIDGVPGCRTYDVAVTSGVPCEDEYEDDNVARNAKEIATNGVAQAHNFHVPPVSDCEHCGHSADQADWVWFWGSEGVTYTIKTSALGGGNDTVLELYEVGILYDPTLAPLAANDDYDGGIPASKIVWQAPETGKYYIKVSPFDPRVGGCGVTYDVDVLPWVSRLELSPKQVMVSADGVDAATLTTTIRDDDGATISWSQTVCFTVTMQGKQKFMCKQTENGQVSVTLTSTVPSTARVWASVGSLQDDAEVTFTPPYPVLQEPSPPTLAADDESTTTLTALVRYNSGTVVDQAAVSFDTTLGEFIWQHNETDENGEVSAALKSSESGTAIVTVELLSYTLDSGTLIVPGGTDDVSVLFEPPIYYVYMPLVLQNYPPQADFTVSQGEEALQKCFTDTSIGADAITERLWDFGDGATSVERNPCHTYEEEGDYEVSLTIYFAGGSDTETKEVPVYPPRPDFTADPMSGPWPLTVTFEDQSTGEITDWRWDFGDEGESDQQNPSHTYTSPGVFDVSLTISTPLGDYIEAKEGYIRTCVMNDPDNGRWGEKGWCEAGDNGKWCEDVSYAGVADASYAPGPLCPAADYIGYITPATDKADVYFIDLAAQGSINIELVVPDAGVDYDLYLYQDSWTPYGDYLAKSVNGGAADEQITYNGGAGRYFIEVWAYEGYSSGAPYILTVDYD